MAPRKTKQQRELEKGLAVFAAYAANNNLDLGVDKIVLVETDEHEEISKAHEADAVLLSLHYPHKMTVKKCKYCGEPFATNYCFVGYCSHSHRKKALAEFGIEWNHDGQPVWGRHEPPLIVNFPTILKLEAWANWLLTQMAQLKDQCLEGLEIELEDAVYESVPRIETEPASALVVAPETRDSPLTEVSGGAPASLLGALQILEIGDILI